jgi:phospholipid transport system substrate-binding protein
MVFPLVKNIVGKMLTVVVCASLFSSPSFAAPVNDASKYIEALGNSAIETLTNKQLDKETKSQKIEQLFRENVDTAWIGKFVLGRFWRQITDDQKTRYLKEYETFLVRNYATRFTDYTSGSFKITDARTGNSNNEFIISMQIKSEDVGGEPIEVDYRVRSDKNRFLVVDIIVEGVSMITTQRDEFTSILTNRDMEYLISQIAKKSDIAIPKP